MKVLVLGGTGAMGGYLVELLACRGDSVHVTTRQERESEHENVKYIRGNAHELSFLKPLLESGGYNAVIDFMVYNTSSFRERHEILTGSTGHYVFFSSARVYADSKTPITESSPRLLDASHGSEYLKTDEYALTKARQEDILRNGRNPNWTIIRPYITYSNERLQLGVYEKESWLYRALHGRYIVFSEDIAERLTTMTWGQDVAGAIAGLAGRRESFGEAYHITGDDSMRWRDIAELYVRVIREVSGLDVKVHYIPKALQDTAQVKYDRLYDRVFDNGKIKSAVKDFRPVSIREGLTRCLTEFIRDSHAFKYTDWMNEARMDRLSGCRASMNELPDSFRARAKYYVYRYCPVLGKILRKGRKIFRRG